MTQDRTSGSLSSEPSDKVVLVVDDDPGIQDLLTLALEGEGYAVLRAGDGWEALSSLEQIVPDVIILDLMMPRLDGPGFLRELEKRGMRDRLRILLLSASSRGKEYALNLGVESYVDKPFSLPEFLTEVGRLAAV